MASRERRRFSISAAPGLKPETIERIWRTAPRASVPLLYLAAAMVGLSPVHRAMAAGTNPPLPTPCAGAPCGTNPGNTPFVQSGNVNLPTVNGTGMTINQLSNTAILNWKNFNIANGYSVKFNQPNSTASALNEIWSADPSVIAGKLSANGQIYLVNQNGIVFAQGAQVNVGSLVASTLNINSNDYLNGLLSKNPGAAGSSGPVGLNAVFSDGSAASGGIEVDKGASITTADGGRILLLGTAVTNYGNLSAPDGQVVMGAGDQVYLAASTDPGLRGVLIEVSNSNNSVSTVTNQGQISSDRGNVTLAGMVVNQAGVINATSSVSANGSIDLVAGEVQPGSSFYENRTVGNQQIATVLPTEGGTLTLAAGSVTSITADPTDTGTVSTQNESNYIPSQVNLIGDQVLMLGNANITAHGGVVNATASSNPFSKITDPTSSSKQSDGSRIYVDSSSVIDVSGLQNVAAPVTENLVSVRLETNDLQDDPLLRDGFLHGATVIVDVNQGSTLFNTAPYAGNVTHTVAEEMAKGGAINLNSDGDVITRAGSLLNVSGGSIAFQGGEGPAITQLIGVDGKIYSITNAPNNIEYIGFANSYSYTDPKWGTTSSWTAQSYYAGYNQGASAGSISIEAPQMYLRGSLKAETTLGQYQRSAASLPAGGTLVIGANIDSVLASPTQADDFRAPGVILADGAQDVLGAAFDPYRSSFPTSSSEVTTISPGQLTASGFTTLDIHSNGAVILPQGNKLALGPNGNLWVQAQQVEIDGSITGAGANVLLESTNRNIGSFAGGDIGNHDIILGSNALIDVSGNWINDSPLAQGQNETTALLYNAGSVTLHSENDVRLGDGSEINVSGGGWVSNQNKLTAGAGGSIALISNYQVFNPTVGVPLTGGIIHGNNIELLGGVLQGGKQSSLTMQSAYLTIGDVAQIATDSKNDPTGELVLSPEAINAGFGGFGNYTLIGINGVNIGSSTDAVSLHPIETNLVFGQNFLSQATGTALSTFTQLQDLGNDVRQAANLTLKVSPNSSLQIANGLGNLVLAAGSSITTDAKGSVSLIDSGFLGNISVLGNITAPAGTINVQLGAANGNSGPYTSADAIGYVPEEKLLIGATADLSATGYDAINTLNAKGYRQGSVLNGGTINLTANKGFVVVEQGAKLDVDATSGTIDIVNASGVTPTVVAGNAGAINIEAREGIVLEGSLTGRAADVVGSSGGSLTVGLDLLNYAQTQAYYVGTTVPPEESAQRTLTITSAPLSSLSQDLVAGTSVISTRLLSNGSFDSGFDNLTFKSTDVIAFSGNVALTAKNNLVLDAPVLSGSGTDAISLSGAHVALGNFYDPSGKANPADLITSPASGLATLQVNGQLIDVRGHSALSGFQSAVLDSAGDLRLAYGGSFDQQTITTPDGSSTWYATGGLYTAGDLTLQASQIYPTTATSFTINTPGTLTIERNGTNPATPLSAGGQLIIQANAIDQGGVLRAPLGQIYLLAGGTTTNGVTQYNGNVKLEAGSVTSVSADGLLLPYGLTQNGQQYLYNFTSTVGGGGGSALISAPLAKQIDISGGAVTISGTDTNGHAAANVNVSGGGDLYAYEFIAGHGGSKDVLSPASGVYQYAIMPSVGASTAPLDAQYSGGADPYATGASIAIGKQVYLSGVPGLAAGYYTLMPAYYALLPGAYAVQVVKQNSDLAAGTVLRNTNGSYTVAAKFSTADTDIVDSRTSTLVIAPDAVVRTQSQYNDTYANAFFTAQAAANQTFVPARPADAGQLALDSSGSLTLDGNINFAAGSFVNGKDANGNPLVVAGVGGTLAIAAPDIQVVDTVSSGSGALQIAASTLDALSAQTIILGATENLTAAGQQLNVSAQTVELSNYSTALQAPTVILAATNTVRLDSGSQLSSTGTGANTGTSAIAVTGDGALLRVSSGQQVGFSRSGLPANPKGTLVIDAGAQVNATGSLILDAEGNAQVDSTATLVSPAVSIASSRVSLGDVPSDVAGLNLSSQLLSSLQGLTSLTITSASSIDFYGNVQLGTLNGGKPQLQSVVLDAGGIGGYGNAGGEVDITAGSISLQNNGNLGAGSSPGWSTSPNGNSALVLTALATDRAGSGIVTLGSNNKQISGFESVAINAGNDIIVSGKGALNVVDAGGLTLTSARIVSASGATQSIVNQTGIVTVDGTATTATLPSAGLGGKLTIVGTEVDQNGTIDLPGGILSLEATGPQGVNIKSGSVTTVAGTSVSYFDTYATAGGGTISLTADQGNVSIASGATIDVSGASSADGKHNSNAGALSISAANGLLQLASGAVLKGGAASGQQQGSFLLDVGSLQDSAATNFSTLNAALSAGGLTGLIDERVRAGDVTIASTDSVRASSFQLATDQGSITVAGIIDTHGGDAVGADGGTIALWAQQNVKLLSGSKLIADAGATGAGFRNARGGNIILSASAGSINLQSGSVIHSTGATAVDDGTLTLRAKATNNETAVNIDPVGATITTSKAVIVEGYTLYKATSLGGSGDAAGNFSVDPNAGQLYSDASTLAGNAATILAGLGLNNAELRPDIVVQSSSDLTLNGTWDLSQWHFNGVPVDVTLQAAGNLKIAGSISDGFAGATPSAFLGLGTGIESASYRLTGGADLSAANPMAVVSGAGNFVLNPDNVAGANNLIRTGTGNIDIAAGGNVVLNDQTSVIYTAGIQAPTVAGNLFTLPAGTGLNAAYPTQGGNVTITADGDIQGTPSTQLISDWMWRRGLLDANGNIKSKSAPSWFINFAQFQEGVGAFGGGNVAIRAGGNIVNLSAVVPSTGQLTGAQGDQPNLNNLLAYGGGNLIVEAAGNIDSGVFEVDRGNARIVSGGSLDSGFKTNQTDQQAGEGTPVYPILVYGYDAGSFDLSARQDITLDAAINATVLPESTANVKALKNQQTGNSYFYTYGASARLNLTSAAGNVYVHDNFGLAGVSNDGLAPPGPPAPYDGSYYASSNFIVYPATVTMAALSGSIYAGSPLAQAASSLTLFPSADGNLNLLAANTIAGIALNMSEVDPAQVPGLTLPSAQLSTNFGSLEKIPLPQIPLHQDDNEAIRLIANAGDIDYSNGSSITFPKSAELVAGGSIIDLNYSGKNLNPSDVTLFQAGKDIFFDTAYNSSNQLVSNASGINIAGPGFVELLAGGKIDLGDGNGVVTSANLNDLRLSSSGASIVAAAGLGTNADGSLRQPDYADFIGKYIAPDSSGNPSSYASQLIAYMAKIQSVSSDSLSYTDALAAFNKLSRIQQLPLISEVLSDELSATGIAHNKTGDSYDRGYTAINTLFPTQDSNKKPIAYSGDINLSFSQLKTESGGNIDLLAPGGSVVVGLPNPPSSLYNIKATTVPPVAAAGNLGLLVLGQGAIRGMVENSFNVNQSRILTLQGGDIILWASQGDIDAGSGAKTASAAPPPVIETDASGNVFVNPIGAVSGSGIGQLLTVPGLTPGIVNLIAPNGTVDAGDAGIRVAGNLNIAAQQVIGAGNITVGGSSSGVPVSEAGALAGALSGANSLGDSGKSTADSLAQNLADSAAANQQLADSLRPSFVSVQLYCIGDECEIK